MRNSFPTKNCGEHLFEMFWRTERQSSNGSDLSLRVTSRAAEGNSTLQRMVRTLTQLEPVLNSVIQFCKLHSVSVFALVPFCAKAEE